MSDRKRAIRDYKETPRPMGVFRVLDSSTGYCFLGSSVDLPSMLNRVRFQLEMGSYPDRELQRRWNDHGPDGFEFDVLDTIEPSEDGAADPREDLAELLAMWKAKLAEEPAAD